MTNYYAKLSRVFHALSDPTRRAVLERLSAGPAAVSDLASPFGMALPSFMQHLKVLEGSGLVRSSKTGRVRTYRLTSTPLEDAEQWMRDQRKVWETRLNQLDDYLLKMKASKREKQS